MVVLSFILIALLHRATALAPRLFPKAGITLAQLNNINVSVNGVYSSELIQKDVGQYEQLRVVHGLCKTTTDCSRHQRCAENGLCYALPFWESPRFDISIFIFVFFAAGISDAAGVGGGPLYVPLLLGVLGFDTRESTMMSHALISGGALAAFVYNLRSSHPSKPGRPLINFEMANLMGAGKMAGAQIGSVLHAFTPSLLILILLVATLMHSAETALRNAVKVTAEESMKGHKKAPSSAEADEDIAEMLKRSRKARGHLLLVWMLGLMFVIGKGFFFDMCSPSWWLATLVTTGALGGLTVVFAAQLAKQRPVDAHDIDFQQLAFPMAKRSILAGSLGSLCGIGGAMVMGPVLVDKKVAPQVSTATTSTTLFFQASITIIIYACERHDSFPLDYCAFLSLAAMAGAIIGKMLMGVWMRKTGKTSLIVWMLAGMTLVSVVLMGGRGALDVSSNPAAAISFQNECPGSARFAL